MLIPMPVLARKYGVRPREVLHVGAHLGEEARDYLRAGVRKVWWVEANPALITPLIANTERLPGHHVIEAAVGCEWERGEKAVLHLADNGQSSSLLEPGTHLTHHPEVHFEGTVEVEMTTIDTLAMELLMTPDMLNLDIQGAELSALDGAEAVLAGAKWVYAEVNTEEVYVGCPLLADMDEFMEGHGYGRAALEMTRHGWGDGLYVRRDT